MDGFGVFVWVINLFYVEADSSVETRLWTWETMRSFLKRKNIFLKKCERIGLNQVESQ